MADANTRMSRNRKKEMEQHKTGNPESLLEKLKKYHESEMYPYHMPGHKQQAVGELDPAITGIDITEIDGFDNLHQPEGILLDLEKKAARLYGSGETFLLINGSTCGVLSAVSAAVRQGGRLLMTRNSHKSAYHAAYLRNLELSFLYPAVDAYGIPEAITPEQVERSLEKDTPDAVFIVSPTYEGKIASVAEIARLVHRKGIPLIVDEAHGAHLGFDKRFGENSCHAGADLVVHSVHKTLPALTQTALLHVNGTMIDRERLRRFLAIYQSSSPSYILMAGIENTLHFLEEDAGGRFAAFYQNYMNMIQHLKKCKHLEFPGADASREVNGAVQDVGKLVISARKCGVSGQELYDILRERFHLQLEMAAMDYCLAMFTVCDPAEAYERMERACLQLDKELEEIPDVLGSNVEIPEISSEKTIPFHRAWEMKTEDIPLTRAAGRYAGDFLNLYPPGVPCMIPGEVWSQELCRKTEEFISRGLRVQGVHKKGSTADNIYVKVIRDVSISE